MSTRESYRHGDLRRALVKAGTALARKGGPAAVVLREATRRAGVTAAAAYRHFADHQALLEAVCASAQALVAIAIEREQAELTATGDPREDAIARFRAVGQGYIRFARAEPNLFRTAFLPSQDLHGIDDPARAGRTGKTPFRLLTSALDDLVVSGAMPPQRRTGAEFLAWSGVHGLATLAIDGPLRALDPKLTDMLTERVIDMVQEGLLITPQAKGTS
ncbi:MAG TPA: TetR/AcrR family transcriptional regulator [Candidatus Elarobacter sp.]